MTTTLTTASVRVVDPILSTIVQGYRQSAFVGNYLFPRVPVSVSGGKILKFGKEAFQLYNARRAPGSATKRIQFGYAAGAYALEQDRLEGKVPREWLRDAAAVPGIDLGTRAVNNVMGSIALSLECQQAALATNTDNYDADHKKALAGATRWSTDTGKPVSDIKDGKEAIRATTGTKPNVLVLSPSAWNAASENPQVLERRKYVEKGPVTIAEFAAMVEVETVVVGEAVYHDGKKFVDVWGNGAVLAYAPQQPAGIEQPSYGYTYAMEGHPLVEAAYFDNGEASWIYPVTYERAPVLTGEVSGFLITGCK